jgi:hypothetical protein
LIDLQSVFEQILLDWSLSSARYSNAQGIVNFPSPTIGLIRLTWITIRLAHSYWDAHNNTACRGESNRALFLYNTLTKEQKQQILQVLRVLLRYRNEKYFGAYRTPPKSARKSN